MLCCSSNTVQSTLQPYEYRTLLVKKIHQFAQRGIFGQATNVFRELSSNIGVNAASRRLSNLGIREFLKSKEILVDRQAHQFIQRLQEALFRKDERQVSHICKLLTRQFTFAPSEEVMEELNIQNKETLQKSDLGSIYICGLDLSKKRNSRKLLSLISRCPKVKKIDLPFCKLGNEQVSQILKVAMKLEALLFLGFRGNRLEMIVADKLLNLLEDLENFPSLLWVDFRNNDINAIPCRFVELTAARRQTRISQKTDSCEEIRLMVQNVISGKIE